MTFLNPLFLLGLLGVAVPLLIHLLSRRTARRVDFSSLTFLMNLEKKSMRRVRIRQWLLLLARMAIIACVSLAMARPTVTNVTAGNARASTSVVIILDASYSMGALVDDVSLFDLARGRAREIVSTLADGDEVVLLVPGAATNERTEPVRDLELAREAVDASSVGLGRADLASTVRDAARILEEARHANREIHVVSDFQAGSWEGLREEEEDVLGGARLFLFPVGEDRVPAGAWVESVDYSGQILERGSPLEFRAVIGAASSSGAEEVDVQLEIDGEVVDRRRVDLGPNARVSIAFRATLERDGLHLGTVSLDGAGTGLPDDDRRFFTLRTAREVPVLLVSEDPRAARYLESALAPEGASVGGFAVRRDEAAALETASREREAVIVLADVERLGESALAGLKSFLSEGGGMLVFPGPRTDASAWGRSFLPKFLPGQLADLKAAPEAFQISELDPSHPLFDLFRENDGGLRDVRFTRTLEFLPEAGTSVLARYGNGDVAIAESTLLPGRVLYFTSSLDPTWSDLPLTGAYLPLLHEAVRYLSETGAQVAQDLDVGDGTKVPLAQMPGGGAVTLTSPDGTLRAAGIETVSGRYALELPEADVPGFWTFVSARDETLAVVAASIPSSESDPTRLAADIVQERLAGNRGAVLEGRESLGDAVRQARLGREVGRWFLWAAALFLLAEMFLASRARGIQTADA